MDVKFYFPKLPKKSKPITVSLRRYCAKLKIDKDLFLNSHKPEYVKARRDLVALLYKKGHKISQIARHFNKPHSTIISMLNKINQEIELKIEQDNNSIKNK